MRAMPPMKIDWWVEKRGSLLSGGNFGSLPLLDPKLNPLLLFPFSPYSLGGQLLFSFLLPSWVASPTGAPIYELSKKRAKEEGERLDPVIPSLATDEGRRAKRMKENSRSLAVFRVCENWWMQKKKMSRNRRNDHRERTKLYLSTVVILRCL